MTTLANERIELNELQERLAKREDFGDAVQRLQRLQRMIAQHKREVKVVLHSTRGEWKTFRAHGSCHE